MVSLGGCIGGKPRECVATIAYQHNLNSNFFLLLRAVSLADYHNYQSRGSHTASPVVRGRFAHFWHAIRSVLTQFGAGTEQRQCEGPEPKRISAILNWLRVEAPAVYSASRQNIQEKECGPERVGKVTPSCQHPAGELETRLLESNSPVLF